MKDRATIGRHIVSTRDDSGNTDVELENLLAAATPGPWRSDGIRIGARGAGFIGTALARDGAEDSSRERNANAHLMAAARELAEQLLILRQECEVLEDEKLLLMQEVERYSAAAKKPRQARR